MNFVENLLQKSKTFKNTNSQTILLTKDEKINTFCRWNSIKIEAKIEADLSNKIFFKMLSLASSIIHDVFVTDELSQKLLTTVASRMCQFDLVPTTLIAPSYLKIEKQIEIFVNPCTCSNIINNAITASFKVDVLKYDFTEKYNDVLKHACFLLSSPKCLGRFHKIENKIGFLVRPTSVFKIILL